MRKFLDKLESKMIVAEEESDFSYFFSLLVTGEVITKLVTLITVSALTPEKDRHQYRILHGLVRAGGVGDWSKGLEDLLSGPASHNLTPEFAKYRTQLTIKTSKEEWQYIAVTEMIAALAEFNIIIESSQAKKDIKSWFKLFTELRNKTRGHGALISNQASGAAIHLKKSIHLLLENLNIFDIPTVYIKRNFSGKYRITNIGIETDHFDELKKRDRVDIEDGVYIYLGGYRRVRLLLSDPELNDFYIANGNYTSKKYELLSYCTDDKKVGESSEYHLPVGVLPPSESEGLGELHAAGNCFTNVPHLSYEYIDRSELENQLYELLCDDRRTMVTLLGRGGIGKTSIALRVIPRLYETTRYDAVIWFSSRDIDLQSSGVKLVTPNVVTSKDISKYYCAFVLSEEDKQDKAINPLDYFQNQLLKSEIGPCLFIFDNFETTENPTEIFKWLDTYIRHPNKILITTRLREFVGDYPLTVHGMTETESIELILLSASQLGVGQHLTKTLINEVYKVSAGHPYIIKIMLGELSKNNMKGSLPKIIANSDEVLLALFERTYVALTPCAQRVFLTLASWNSVIPRIALEAVLMVSYDEPLEVEISIETLLQYSLIEEFKSSFDDQYFIVLPLSAISFGARKLRVSPLKSIIIEDVRILQRFGPEKSDNKKISLTHHIFVFLSSFDSTIGAYRNHKNLIEKMCMSYIHALPVVALWLEESMDEDLWIEAKRYLLLYLENDTSDSEEVEAWNQIAVLSKKLQLPLEEVHALIEASQFTDIDFSELSNVVNRVNNMLGSQELVIDNMEAKTELLTKLYDVAWRRKSEADAVDYSRLAWLAMHLHKVDKAKELVESGLSLDPHSSYCLRLKDKFGS